MFAQFNHYPHPPPPIPLKGSAKRRRSIIILCTMQNTRPLCIVPGRGGGRREGSGGGREGEGREREGEAAREEKLENFVQQQRIALL